ncbi:MAG TPA: hypothetical protein VN461_04835 [Vicinamibacteria bacterium]|nr:hypothetical protein [Vicinamibacteria bacterium]
MGLSLTYVVHLAFWDEYRWFALFLLLFLLGVHGQGRVGLFASALASVLAGFFLLMRVSLGVGALLAVGLGCLLQRRASAVISRLLLVSGFFSAGLLVPWAARYGTTRGLATHLVVSRAIASGYSSAMSLALEGWEVAAGSFLVFFLLLAAWAVFQRHGRACLSLAGCSFPLLVTWKHSVVRQDVHARVLVLFGLVIVAVLITDSLTAERRWRASPILAGAVVSLLVAWLHSPVDDGPPVQTLVRALTQPLGLPGVAGLEALVQLQHHRAHLAQLSIRALEPLVLPTAERAVLADSTVDVYPWEASYVAANHLNWANRPFPTSFQTYNPALDRLNASFFDSPRRPQRLLWHKTPGELLRTPGAAGVASIDGRHLFWDEPLTLVSILNHYELVSAGSVFLLAPRAEPRFLSRRQIATLTVPWGAWTPVPDRPGVILAEIGLRRPPSAQLRRLLFREEEMSIDVRFRARRMIHCRFIPDQAASGLWISPLPHNAASLEALLSGALPEQGQVAEIRFWNGWRGVSAPDLRISWVNLETRAFSASSPLAVSDRVTP